MTVLSALWLPTLLSGVFVFVVSAIVHMALQWWHRSDYGKLPDEARVMDALRPFGIPPGDYMVPNCASGAEMKTPEFKEKMNKGPVMMVTVTPNGMPNMAKALGLWLLYTLAVSAFAAYVAGHALPFGASCRHVIRFAGVTAFLGYAGALWQMSIWYQRSWMTTIKTTIDGAIYAAITAATFAWLWPR
jgi:hypothetical protein